MWQEVGSRKALGGVGEADGKPICTDLLHVCTLTGTGSPLSPWKEAEADEREEEHQTLRVMRRGSVSAPREQLEKRVSHRNTGPGGF